MKPYFVYVVDSFGEHHVLDKVLEQSGLVVDETYYISHHRNSSVIFDMEDEIGAKNLLVFMSTFSGTMDGPVALSEQIKKANPKAKIIFRSTFPELGKNYPIFERSIAKGDMAGPDQMPQIIREFLASQVTE